MVRPVGVSAPTSAANTSITAGGNVTYQVTNNYGGSGSIFDGKGRNHHRGHDRGNDDYRSSRHHHHGGYGGVPAFMMNSNNGGGSSVFGNVAKGALVGGLLGGPGGMIAGGVVGGGSGLLKGAASFAKSVFSGW